MKEKFQKKHSADSLFTFLLLLIFALSALMLSAMGSAVYRNGIEHMNENYTSRTAVAYLSEKIRQHDETDGIFLTDLDDIPAICFQDQVQDEIFVTYIYFYEGYLRELFIRKDMTPLAALGTPVVELDDFSLECLSASDISSVDTDVIYMATAISQGGNAQSVLLHPRCQ